MIPEADLKVTPLLDPPGGQHVGVRTGVRVEHLPTGIAAEVETERSRMHNRRIALDMIEGALTSPHFRG